MYCAAERMNNKQSPIRSLEGGFYDIDWREKWRRQHNSMNICLYSKLHSIWPKFPGRIVGVKAQDAGGSISVGVLMERSSKWAQAAHGALGVTPPASARRACARDDLCHRFSCEYAALGWSTCSAARVAKRIGGNIPGEQVSRVRDATRSLGGDPQGQLSCLRRIHCGYCNWSRFVGHRRCRCRRCASSVETTAVGGRRSSLVVGRTSIAGRRPSSAVLGRSSLVGRRSSAVVARLQCSVVSRRSSSSVRQECAEVGQAVVMMATLWPCSTNFVLGRPGRVRPYLGWLRTANNGGNSTKSGLTSTCFGIGSPNVLASAVKFGMGSDRFGESSNNSRLGSTMLGLDSRPVGN